MVWLWLIFGGPIIALMIKKFIQIPSRPKLLHTPYARPGPWHYVKLLAARIWLAYRLVRHPRVLNTYDMKSTKYEKLGVVASELEKVWELPKKLIDRESLDGMFFYGTDGLGTFLKLSINRQLNRQAQVSLLFTLPDGTSYELPNAPDTTISDTDGSDTFNAGGIKFQLIEAMRKWRIIFNGFAKRCQNGEETEVHLRINMVWTAFSRPYEFKREFSRKLLASGMARELWRGRQEWWRMSEPNYNGVDQWGVMSGTFQEGSQNEEKELYLRGVRQRRWGQNNSSTLHRKLDIIGTCEDGNYFYLSATSDSSRLTHEVWGHLYHPNGILYKINSCNLDLEKLGENGPVPRHFSLRFSAKRRHYHAIIHLMPSHFENFIGRPWRHQSTIYPCHLTLNSRQGRVLFTVTNTFQGHCPLDVDISSPYLAPPSRSLTSAENGKIVLLFNEEACRYECLVGGKGSSLALLSTIKKSKPIDFTLPQGFCLTINAWNRQMNENKDLLMQLKELREVGKGVIEGQLEECCKETSELLALTPVDSFIQDCIREALQELFGEEIENKRLAVRSSVIGEDGKDLSSAGQNATVLGCKGYDAIIKGLQQCWSSLLSYQSVEYRRQHGDPLIPGMGVVVQEMVDSEVAGVLFTVNPNDGDPSRMIITANYGLGESVVSGSAEPDTIILKRTSSGLLSVKERTIGSKHLKIVLTEDGTQQEMATYNSGSSCLSDEIALNLGQLGIHLEKSFGGPRDIEFSIRDNSVYLLQARPVTSLDSWSDQELLHEFDSAIVTDDDYLTKSNTVEMVPGAATPLSISTTLRLVEFNFQMVMKKQFGRLVEANPWSIGRFFCLHQNQLFFSVVNAFLRDVDAEISDSIRAIDMAVFGHIVTTPAIHRLGVQRFGVAGLRVKFHRYRTMIHDFLFNSRRIRRAETKFADYSFPVDQYSDPKTLYGEICVRMPVLSEIGRIHTSVSRASATSQLIAFMILLEGRKEWTPELYTEMAQLIGSISTAETAEVPLALKELAKAIADSEHREEFVKQSADEACKMLKEDEGTPGRLFRDFLARHGHRSIMEFDFSTETWGLNPRSLVSALQTIVANPASFAAVSKQGNDDWMIDIQKTKPYKYRALKFFVPRSRDSVAYREKTKSLLIRTIHCFRLAYRRLGQLMVWDGKIPDAGLIYFFTHSELQQVISSRGTTLINKAVRRRKLYPEVDALVFPEMSLGIPKAIQESENEESETGCHGIQVTGTPVFKGTVRATARVALNLHEARDIQCGEVLITRCTDIGWTPYFPLLSGVVTELGGLISHGAVVTREYGLPCIVGAQKVTHMFRTGDTVILDGTKGTITRVDVEMERK